MRNAKIVILGDGAVGKTALINNWVEQKFDNSYVATIGVDIVSHTIKLKNNTMIRLDAWDLAGQSHFKSIRSKFYRQSVGAILVFDVTNISTFENIKDWVAEAENAIGKKIPMILLGNKIDLNYSKLISLEGAREQTKSLGISTYMETSALTGEGVSDAFLTMAHLIIKSEREKNQ